jgi:hypothetical protein
MRQKVNRVSPCTSACTRFLFNTANTALTKMLLFCFISLARCSPRLSSSSAKHCFCVFRSDSKSPLPSHKPVRGADDCPCLSGCRAASTSSGLCPSQALDASELAKHLLLIGGGRFGDAPAIVSGRDLALLYSSFASTLMGDDFREPKEFSMGYPEVKLTRKDICCKALSMDPSCAQAYSALRDMLDPRGDSVVVNGETLTARDLFSRGAKCLIRDPNRTVEPLAGAAGGSLTGNSSKKRFKPPEYSTDAQKYIWSIGRSFEDLAPDFFSRPPLSRAT